MGIYIYIYLLLSQNSEYFPEMIFWQLISTAAHVFRWWFKSKCFTNKISIYIQVKMLTGPCTSFFATFEMGSVRLFVLVFCRFVRHYVNTLIWFFNASDAFIKKQHLYIGRITPEREFAVYSYLEHSLIGPCSLSLRLQFLKGLYIVCSKSECSEETAFAHLVWTCAVSIYVKHQFCVLRVIYRSFLFKDQILGCIILL